MKAEHIRARYFGEHTFEQLDAERASIIKRDLKRGLSKLQKLPADAPLKADVAKLFITTIDAMKDLETESLKQVGQLFEVYIEAYEKEELRNGGK